MASALFDTLNARGMSQRLAQILASAIAGGGLPLVYGAAGTVLVSTGSAAQWGPVDLSDADARTGQLPAANIVTGTSGANIPLLNGANTWSALQTYSAGITFGGQTLSTYAAATYSPTITASGGTFTTTSTSISYVKIGLQVFMSGSITITSAGTASGAILMTLPFNAARPSIGAAAEVATTGNSARVRVDPAVLGATSSSILRYDNASVIGGGNVIEFGLTYEATS